MKWQVSLDVLYAGTHLYIEDDDGRPVETADPGLLPPGEEPAAAQDDLVVLGAGCDANAEGYAEEGREGATLPAMLTAPVGVKKPSAASTPQA